MALSRVKFRGDIRLLLKGGDRSTMDYIEKLAKNARVQSFFDGYDGDMPMTWNKKGLQRLQRLVERAIK